MVKISSITSTALMAAAAAAQDVACLVNGELAAIVDLQTGSCPFYIPPNLPIFFNYESSEDYNIEFYYAIAQNTRYFNDIVNAGNVIEIPAAELYGTSGAPLFQVHLQESPASNSTAAIRKRLLGQAYVKRDEASDFAESAKSQDGVAVNGAVFQVVDPSAVSGTASSASTTATVPVSSGVETIPTPTAADSTATITEDVTTHITITSCSDNVCVPTEVPATQGLTTVTAGDDVTSYTTWCPVSDEGTATVTEDVTTLITITSCSDNKCVPTEVPATQGETTVTNEAGVTSYTTWCPVTDEAGKTATVTEDSTTIITITSCSDNKCVPTEVPATQGETTVTNEVGVTSYTTWCPVTDEEGNTASVSKTASAPAGEGAAATTPAGEGAAATTPAGEGAAATTPAGEDAAATTPAGEGATTSAAGEGAASTPAGAAGEGSTVAGVSTLSSSAAPAASAGAANTVSTYEGAANKLAGSLVLAAIPLAYLL